MFCVSLGPSRCRPSNAAGERSPPPRRSPACPSPSRPQLPRGRKFPLPTQPTRRKRPFRSQRRAPAERHQRPGARKASHHSKPARGPPLEARPGGLTRPPPWASWTRSRRLVRAADMRGGSGGGAGARCDESGAAAASSRARGSIPSCLDDAATILTARSPVSFSSPFTPPAEDEIARTQKSECWGAGSLRAVATPRAPQLRLHPAPAAG